MIEGERKERREDTQKMGKNAVGRKKSIGPIHEGPEEKKVRKRLGPCRVNSHWELREPFGLMSADNWAGGGLDW